MKVDIPAVFEAFLVHELYELARYRAKASAKASGRFQPGEKVPVSGIWSSLEGREACLSQGGRFPPSPSSWGPVRLVRSMRRRPRRKD